MWLLKGIREGLGGYFVIRVPVVSCTTSSKTGRKNCNRLLGRLARKLPYFVDSKSVVNDRYPHRWPLAETAHLVLPLVVGTKSSTRKRKCMSLCFVVHMFFTKSLSCRGSSYMEPETRKNNWSLLSEFKMLINDLACSTVISSAFDALLSGPEVLLQLSLDNTLSWSVDMPFVGVSVQDKWQDGKKIREEY